MKSKYMKFTCGIWGFFIKKILNHHWRDSQSTVMLSMPIIHMTPNTPPSVFTCAVNTPNINGCTGAIYLTWLYIILSDVKTDPSVTITHKHTNIHIHISIFYNHMFWRSPAFIKIRFPCLHKSLVSSIPFFLQLFVFVDTVMKTR